MFAQQGPRCQIWLKWWTLGGWCHGVALDASISPIIKGCGDVLNPMICLVLTNTIPQSTNIFRNVSNHKGIKKYY